MNIFSILKKYATKWQPKEVRPFTAEEKVDVERTEIVQSQYGNSVCFYMKSGGKCYIPCDSDCTKGLGESIDLDTAMIKVLSKEGEDDILRVLA